MIPEPVASVALLAAVPVAGALTLGASWLRRHLRHRVAAAAAAGPDATPVGWLEVVSLPCGGPCRRLMPHEMDGVLARCVACHTTRATTPTDTTTDTKGD